MRNLLSFLALIISLAGVGISVTREEIRCWVGLSSNACQSSGTLQSPGLTRNSSPNLRQETDSTEVNRELSSPTSPVKAIDKSTVETQDLSPVPETQPSPTAEKQDAAVAPTVAKESATPPVSSEEASQPIEVIPPPPESGQPLEVTPPPTTSTP